jgi:opacity protein-like surface antigen
MRRANCETVLGRAVAVTAVLAISVAGAAAQTLASRSANPVAVVALPDAPTPAPLADPAPAAQAAAPSPAPAPPGEYFGWTAAGFIGSSFGTGGQSAAANDVNGSLTYGGQISKMYGHWGAEVIADFGPTYKINSLALSEHPEVNAYMANALGIWNTRFQSRVQPYVSAGIGTIQMHASVLPAVALTGSTTNTKVWENRFGWDVGGGVFAFAGRAIGLRADVRYFSANNSSDSPNDSPAQRVSSALLSGLSFWRANIGVAFRW